MKAKHISSNAQETEEESAGGADERETVEDVESENNENGERDETFTEDEIFHLLQNERRRLVLRYLRGTDEPVRMRDVAEQVAAWEHDTTVAELTSTQRQRVYIPLYQSHLSKLDEAGVIDYQQNRGIVERKPLADEVDKYLQVTEQDEAADEDDTPTISIGDDYYIGATAVCYVALLGAVFELPVLSIISGIGLSALILFLFTLVTASRFIN
ncbi:uncharacterized protein Nmag_3281 [Natrialba magadii ATCC 43099]|uniref:DUF7344 domain-containing protein n=1 Tax=Natrialba magadii (strain ATCC 43099 / DSM 3394 / CCM 3739 / CIP 104546 / IAM 13178 / JCM 8861 / NBRC 102185 / NCIMB 2190 / MS3) TaxID=547559 RepID=D3SSI6_NATMM|nr:hypothetical protein [Natrialba magadii]ADD06831.1 uncharacterized protein Nmag_3281 [Natrialba magadii ATCC 43099]ELY28242.1 hypothetical protein C500_13831 [Natrialba magadii ATCC 43099]